jgi:hypothetical protein
MIAPETEADPTLWGSPTAPGRAPGNTGSIAAQISAARHTWDEEVQTYRTYTSVQQALKKQIITVFEPMYLDVFNDDMVGFANISTRAMIDHLFITYGNITTVDLENNFEHMRRAWDPQQTVESLFKKIQDCANYSEAGGVLIGHPQQIMGIHSRSTLDMQKYLQLGTSRAPVAGGMKSHMLKKLGHTLRPTSPPPTVSTRKCKVNVPQHPDTNLPMHILDKLKTKCPKQPLRH